MQTVSLFDAKTHLSRLIDQIATGAENEIVISRRIGLARGEFDVPDNIDTHNAEVAALFLGGR